MRNKLLESIYDDDDGFFDHDTPYNPDSYLSDEEMAEKGYEKIEDGEDDDFDRYDYSHTNGRAPWSFDKFYSPSGRKVNRSVRRDNNPDEVDKTYYDMENGDDGAFMGDDDVDNQFIEGNSYKDTLKWPNEHAANRSSYTNSRRFRTPEDDEFEKDHVEEVDYDPDELFECVITRGKKKRPLNEGIDDIYEGALYRAKSVVNSFTRKFGSKMTHMAFEKALSKD